MTETDFSNEHRNYLKSFFKNDDTFKIFSLAGDASSRKYYRVVKDEKSWVLMTWEPFVNDGNYPFLSVHAHFERNGVHVPKIIDIAPKLGLVLLEDLGDLTLERKFWETQDQNSVLPYYHQAIEELLRIHYYCTADRSTSTAFQIEFNTERLMWEMNYGKEHLIEKFFKISLSASEEKELDQTFLHICQRLDKEKKYICHRDYHSRNIMLKFSQARIIDFQDARLGPIQYDLVSLIKDSYVDLNEETEKKILNFYLERRRDYEKENISSDHFHEIYQLQSIQRCFKACGSFTSFYNLRQDVRYIKYIHPSIHRVLASLNYFVQYKNFTDFILNHKFLDITSLDRANNEVL